MVQSQVAVRRHALTVGAVLSALVLAGLGLSPAAATHMNVTEVEGSAMGYTMSVSLFGGPPQVRGHGQTACTAPNTPPGCASQPELSSSPYVELPATGGNLSESKSTGTTAGAGPAVIFSSGPMTVTTAGTTGPTGSVTSTADIQDINTSEQEVFTADNLASTCTASETGVTGSTTVVNGTLQTSEGNPDVVGDETVVDIPTNPDPNTTYEGQIETVGDSFRAVFNEQIVNPDGSITVNAYHMYLLGPTAIGDLIVGQVVCGVTTVAAPTTTTEAPTTTTVAPTTTTSGENLPPVAVDDAYTTGEGEELVVPAPGVLANDTDPDGDPLTAGMPTNPSNGTLNLSTNGGFTYTPNAGFSGTDTFTYMAHDPFGGMTMATVTITVTPSATTTTMGATTTTSMATTTTMPATTTTMPATTTTEVPATTTTMPATTTTAGPTTTTAGPTTTTAGPTTTTAGPTTTTAGPTTTTAGPTTTTAGPTTTTAGPTTTTVVAPDGPLTIDDTALSNGQAVRITGTITCDEGLRYRILVDVSQGDTEGSDVVTGSCTGEEQAFRVNVRDVSGPGFEDGPAQVDATAQIGDPDTRTIVDTFSTSEEVEIDVRGGFMGAVVSAFSAMGGRSR